MRSPGSRMVGNGGVLDFVSVRAGWLMLLVTGGDSEEPSSASRLPTLVICATPGGTGLPTRTWKVRGGVTIVLFDAALEGKASSGALGLPKNVTLPGLVPGDTLYT